MPPKKRRAAPRKPRAFIMIPPGFPGVMRGGSAFTDSFTKTIPRAATTVYNSALKPAGNFIKDNHILSTVAGFVPHPGGKVASVVLRQAGLGTPRRKKRQAGAGPSKPRGTKSRMKFN